MVVGVHFEAVDGREGDHDRLHAPLDGLDVGREVDLAEFREGDDGVALVDAPLGATVPDEVLGSGSNEDVAGEGRDGVVSA